MAPSAVTIKAAGTMTFNALNPIFPDNSLPDTYSKNLRRPITYLEAVPVDPIGEMDVDEDLFDEDGAYHGDDSLSVDEDGDHMVRFPRINLPNSAGTLQRQKSMLNSSRPQHSHSSNSTLGKRPHSSTSSRISNAKRIRVAGGRPALAKHITTDLDSDDEIIKVMKDAGVKDTIIRDRLIEEGRTRYDEKTISTRYKRIINVFDHAEEARLEEDFSDFHEDEDESLYNAYDQTSVWYERQLKDLENKRWKSVAKIHNAKMGRTKYSPKACRNRLESLDDGTAIIPQERDPNPEERAVETAARIHQRKFAEVDRRAEAARKAEDDLRVKAEKLAAETEAKQQRIMERAEVKAKNDAIKAEKEAVIKSRQERKDAEIDRKAAAVLEVQRAKDEKERQRVANKVAATLAKKQELAAKSERAAKEKLDKIERERHEQAKKLEKIKYDAGLIEIVHRHMLKPATPTETVTRPSGAQISEAAQHSDQTDLAGGSQPFNDNDDEDDHKNIPRVATPPNQSTMHLFTSSPNNTRDIQIPSPRSKLRLQKLKDLLKSRNLPHSGKKEELVRRLSNNDESMSAKELRDVLKKRGVKSSGSKKEMIGRLVGLDEQGGSLQKDEVRAMVVAEEGAGKGKGKGKEKGLAAAGDAMGVSFAI